MSFKPSKPSNGGESASASNIHECLQTSHVQISKPAGKSVHDSRTVSLLQRSTSSPSPSTHTPTVLMELSKAAPTPLAVSAAATALSVVRTEKPAQFPTASGSKAANEVSGVMLLQHSNSRAVPLPKSANKCTLPTTSDTGLRSVSSLPPVSPRPRFKPGSARPKVRTLSPNDVASKPTDDRPISRKLFSDTLEPDAGLHYITPRRESGRASEISEAPLNPVGADSTINLDQTGQQTNEIDSSKNWGTVATVNILPKTESWITTTDHVTTQNFSTAGTVRDNGLRSDLPSEPSPGLDIEGELNADCSGDSNDDLNVSKAGQSVEMNADRSQHTKRLDGDTTMNDVEDDMSDRVDNEVDYLVSGMNIGHPKLENEFDNEEDMAEEPFVKSDDDEQVTNDEPVNGEDDAFDPLMMEDVHPEGKQKQVPPFSKVEPLHAVNSSCNDKLQAKPCLRDGSYSGSIRQDELIEPSSPDDEPIRRSRRRSQTRGVPRNQIIKEDGIKGLMKAKVDHNSREEADGNTDICTPKDNGAEMDDNDDPGLAHLTDAQQNITTGEHDDPDRHSMHEDPEQCEVPMHSAKAVSSTPRRQPGSSRKRNEQKQSFESHPTTRNHPNQEKENVHDSEGVTMETGVIDVPNGEAATQHISPFSTRISRSTTKRRAQVSRRTSPELVIEEEITEPSDMFRAGNGIVEGDEPKSKSLIIGESLKSNEAKPLPEEDNITETPRGSKLFEEEVSPIRRVDRRRSLRSTLSRLQIDEKNYSVKDKQSDHSNINETKFDSSIGKPKTPRKPENQKTNSKRIGVAEEHLQTTEKDSVDKVEKMEFEESPEKEPQDTLKPKSTPRRRNAPTTSKDSVKRTKLNRKAKSHKAQEGSPSLENISPVQNKRTSRTLFVEKNNNSAKKKKMSEVLRLQKSLASAAWTDSKAVENQTEVINVDTGDTVPRKDVLDKPLSASNSADDLEESDEALEVPKISAKGKLTSSSGSDDVNLSTVSGRSARNKGSGSKRLSANVQPQGPNKSKKETQAPMTEIAETDEAAGGIETEGAQRLDGIVNGDAGVPESEIEAESTKANGIKAARRGGAVRRFVNSTRRKKNQLQTSKKDERENGSSGLKNPLLSGRKRRKRSEGPSAVAAKRMKEDSADNQQHADDNELAVSFEIEGNRDGEAIEDEVLDEGIGLESTVAKSTRKRQRRISMSGSTRSRRALKVSLTDSNFKRGSRDLMRDEYDDANDKSWVHLEVITEKELREIIDSWKLVCKAGRFGVHKLSVPETVDLLMGHFGAGV